MTDPVSVNLASPDVRAGVTVVTTLGTFRLTPLWASDLVVTGETVRGVLIDKLEDSGRALASLDRVTTKSYPCTLVAQDVRLFFFVRELAYNRGR